jgi:hypothetical protein
VTAAGIGVPVREFLRGRWWAVLVTSMVVMGPVFWHERVVSGDLASHVYNAWLAQLIEKGQAPGLYLAHRWNNVVVDVTLLRLGDWFGLVAAERIVVCASVLIFFWGVFALLSAVVGKTPWFLLPCLAMLAYGWTFNIGFFNYYISLGLGFFATAIFWRGLGRELLWGFVFAGLTLLAHPQGFGWLVGCVGYILIWRRLPGWWKLLLPVVAAITIAGIHIYTFEHFDASGILTSFGSEIYTGQDQISLYTPRSRTLSYVAAGFGLICFLVDAVRRKRKGESWGQLRLPFEIYCVAVLATYVLPDDLHVPLYSAWIGAVTLRLTTVTAVWGLCVLAQITPRRWHTLGFAAVAAFSFTYLYQDTRELSRMERDARQLMSALPYGQRVMATVWADGDSRLPYIVHLIDRACVGKCYAYQNYEPPSRQFRVRIAAGGSPLVTSSSEDSQAMEAGEYEVQGEDLPVMQIYQCDENDLTKICMRKLEAGEVNGSVGYHPPK